jgi:hypothetical protein
MPLFPPAGQFLAAPATNALSMAPTGSAPSGAIAQTIPLWLPNTGSVATSSGVLQLHAVTLPAGVPVSNITFQIGNTAGATLSHGWYALVNSALLQVAHTADQTSGSLTGGAAVTKALVTPYVPAATAQYYLGICVVAGTQPTLSGYSAAQASGIFGVYPVNGPSSTGLTTPGTDGTTSYAALTAAADPAYAFAS